MNNKALSTVLATMTIASPLVGAAEPTQDQSQSSKNGNFVKSIKEKVLKHPVEAAVAGVTTVGAAALAAIKLFGKSTKTPTPAPDNPGGDNPNPTPTPVSALPSYLAGIDQSEFQNFNAVLNLFASMPQSEKLNGRDAKNLADSCEAKLKTFLGYVPIFSLDDSIFRILFAMDSNLHMRIKQDRHDTFYFYRDFNTESKKEISNSAFVRIDTTDIGALGNVSITYTKRGNPDHHEMVRLSNSQKAVIIRYLQADYLQRKGVL